ncbi:MAG: hypothetical protein MUF22_08435 [Chitinispirillaceae bacterium]|nr:hypothetical protein [Chitinispirillaceae bacterium]
MVSKKHRPLSMMGTVQSALRAPAGSPVMNTPSIDRSSARIAFNSSAPFISGMVKSEITRQGCSPLITALSARAGSV